MSNDCSDIKITRKQAIIQGLRHYFTGKVCIRGHIDVRYVNGGMCKACDRVLQDKYKSENKEAVLETDRARYDKIKDSKREVFRKQYKKSYQKNKASYIAAVIDRRGGLAKRTVAWANKEAISEFYKNCPPDMTVDHIYPLKGKLVSGLHVENNLQYLTEQENKIKSNKFEVT